MKRKRKLEESDKRLSTGGRVDDGAGLLIRM